jgi:hypothetical protein
MGQCYEIIVVCSSVHPVGKTDSSSILKHVGPLSITIIWGGEIFKRLYMTVVKNVALTIMFVGTGIGLLMSIRPYKDMLYSRSCFSAIYFSGNTDTHHISEVWDRKHGLIWKLLRVTIQSVRKRNGCWGTCRCVAVQCALTWADLSSYAYIYWSRNLRKNVGKRNPCFCLKVQYMWFVTISVESGAGNLHFEGIYSSICNDGGSIFLQLVTTCQIVPCNKPEDHSAYA